MPRQSKSKTQVAETTTVIETPVVEQVVAPVEKATKTSSKVSKVVAPKVDITVPVVVAPVATSEQPVVVENVEVDVGDITAQSTEFLAKLNQLGALFTSLKTEFRALEKKWSREIKTAQKSQAKRKRKSGNRQPSGFVKPTKISDELANFLEKPIGTEMARTDVTREINTYIRAHKLQDKDNGRKINPDDKLAALLKLKKTDELTYFNLQRYMSPHFSKNEKVVMASAGSVTV
jgi:upstream activation factor subunit UAF30